MKINIYNLTLLSWLFSQPSKAQNPELNFPPPDNPPIVRVVKTAEKITLDGSLDEAVWERAPVYTNFLQVEPVQGEQPNLATAVRLLFDDAYIYVGVFCQDSVGKAGVRIRNLERDFEWGSNDLFGISFDPFDNQQYMTTFQATPYGNQRDMQVFYGEFFDPDYDGLWQVRTKMTDDGWFAEFKIPFKTLRYPKPTGGEASWRISFVRRARRSNQIFAMPLYPRSFGPYRPEYAGKTADLKPPPSRANIRIQPYLLYQNDRQKVANQKPDISDSPKMGGELRWAITPQSVLDFTLNTDFAQADVDRAVQNLTRFSVLFPERRQFFLENSGLFRLDPNDVLNPFFSRTIGLDATGNPIPIDAGLRFVNRTRRHSIGGMVLMQNKLSGQQGSVFSVARYERRYRKQDNVGILVTNRLDDALDGGRSKSNTTMNLSGFNRPTETVSLSYFLSHSFSTSDGADVSHGWGGKFSAFKTTNQYVLKSTHYLISEHYDAAMGFVIGKNILYHNPGGYLNFRPKWRPKSVRAFEPGIWANIYQNVTNLNVFEASLEIYPLYVRLHSDTRLSLTYRPYFQNVQQELPILGIKIAPGEYTYHRFRFWLSTNPSSRLSCNVTAETGGYFNGNLQTLNTELRYAPIPHIQFIGGAIFNRIRELGTTETDKNARLYTTSLRLSLNPRVHLTTFYQYNSESFGARHRVNVRFAWEYMPLSFLFITLNNFSGIRPSDKLSVNAFQSIGKIMMTKQF